MPTTNAKQPRTLPGELATAREGLAGAEAPAPIGKVCIARTSPSGFVSLGDAAARVLARLASVEYEREPHKRPNIDGRGENDSREDACDEHGGFSHRRVSVTAKILNFRGVELGVDTPPVDTPLWPAWASRDAKFGTAAPLLGRGCGVEIATVPIVAEEWPFAHRSPAPGQAASRCLPASASRVLAPDADRNFSLRS